MVATEIPMKIKALAPWFGAKRNLAPAIVKALGPHRSYWEPFCGSLAVLLAKPPASMETVNDLHGDIINLARVVKSTDLGPHLYRMLRRTLFDETLLEEARAKLRDCPLYDIDEPDPLRAYHYFIGCWLGRNGNAGLRETKNGGWVCVRWTHRGGHPGTRWAGAVASIPAWRRRLRNVTILCRDGFDILERIEDDTGTAIYVDPPYFIKADIYAYDFAPEDHERLARALHRFTKARVVVSYYQDPRLEILYPKKLWKHIPVYCTKSLAQQNHRGQTGKTAVAPEMLLVNGDQNEELFP
jgi:DNA adenine methylase